MLEFSKRLGLCLGMAAAFCLGACGDDDSSSDKGKTNSGGNSDVVECENNDDCKDVEGKPVCDQDKKECVEEKKDDSGKEDGGSDGSEDGSGDGSEDGSGDGSGNEDEQNKGCLEGQELCGSECADLKSDSNHCGNCDTVCTGGKTCVSSQCDFVCNDENMPDKCEDGCHNFKTDNNNCGKCGEKCESNESCIDGICGSADTACTAEQKLCSEECKNILVDNENCGDCDKPCTDGQICQNGKCEATCPAGETKCSDGKCYNLDSDLTCGACNETLACDASKDEHCSSSRTCETACAKDDGTLEFVNFKTDKNHCGGCSGPEHVCDESQICDDGKCVKDCGEGKYNCNGICVDPQTDAEHCGCGDQRADEEIKLNGINCTMLTGVTNGVCESGSCKVTCDALHGDCNNNPSDGCEADLTAAETCGVCSHACNDPNAIAEKTLCQVNREKMEESACNYTCKDDMVACNGECKNLNNDKNNCGWCDNKCSDDADCINGFCTIDVNKCVPDEDNDLYVTTTISGQPVKLFCVRTAAELSSIAMAVNSGKKYPTKRTDNNNFIIVAKIDMTPQTSYPSIGTSSMPYSGVFLGNGMEISGKLNTTSGSYKGLFGYVKKAYLSGFNLNLTTKYDSSYGGALAGYVTDSSVSACVSSGTTTGAGAEIGNLIGWLEASSLNRIKTSGELTSTDSSSQKGGIIGRCQNSKNVSNLISATKVTSTGSTNVGGVAGWINNCDLTDVKASGDVAGYLAGGVVATISVNSTAAKLLRCHASGKVTGSNYSVGGLVGRVNDGQNNVIEDCSATGDVEILSSGGNYGAGALIGYANNLDLKNSFATGKVSTKDGSINYMGGLVGKLLNSKISNCHYSGEGIIKDAINDNNSYVGGLVGHGTNITLKDVYAEAKMIKGNLRVGGLIGAITGASTIENAWVKGEVWSSSCRVGGVIGEVLSTTKITKVISSTKISANCENGGFIGYNVGGESEIIDSVTLGESYDGTFPSGQWKGAPAGMIGANTSKITVRNSYTFRTFKGGRTIGAVSSTSAFKNSYYWNGMSTTLFSTTPSDASVFPFGFDENKEAIETVGSKKLVEVLGSSGSWTKNSYTVTTVDESIPGIPVQKKTTYSVPVPQFDNLILPNEL